MMAAKYDWDHKAPIHVRLLRARADLRGSKLWTKFAGDTRDFDAFSIHELAAACEDKLAAHGVTYNFSVEKWSMSGAFRLVEGWATFIAVDSGETHKIYTVGEGWDQSDRGFGKAISYARKNGMIQGLNLAVGVDNEATRERPPAEAAPAAASGSAPKQHGYSLVFGNMTHVVPANEVVTRVVGYINTLANVAVVEEWEEQNQATLDLFWADQRQQAFVLKRSLSLRKSDLRPQAVGAADDAA